MGKVFAFTQYQYAIHVPRKIFNPAYSILEKFGVLYVLEPISNEAGYSARIIVVDTTFVMDAEILAAAEQIADLSHVNTVRVTRKDIHAWNVGAQQPAVA